MYYSRVMVSQLGGEHRITIANATGKPDPVGQIQLDVTLRQMKEAYDSSPKPAVIELFEPCLNCADIPPGRKYTSIQHE
jgi:hypothetical protein